MRGPLLFVERQHPAEYVGEGCRVLILAGVLFVRPAENAVARRHLSAVQ
jgi:hypothetical protein